MTFRRVTLRQTIPTRIRTQKDERKKNPEIRMTLRRMMPTRVSPIRTDRKKNDTHRNDRKKNDTHRNDRRKNEGIRMTPQSEYKKRDPA
jgi:hypothetical protein